MTSTCEGRDGRPDRFRQYGVVTGVAASLAVLALDIAVAFTPQAFTPVSPRRIAVAAGGALAIVWLGVGVLALVDRAAIAAGTRASQLTTAYSCAVAVAVAAAAAAAGSAITATWRGPATIAALIPISATAISCATAP